MGLNPPKGKEKIEIQFLLIYRNQVEIQFLHSRGSYLKSHIYVIDQSSYEYIYIHLAYINPFKTIQSLSFSKLRA